MGILDKVVNAKVTSGGTWITDGDYSFVVEKIGIIPCYPTGEAFVAELYVDESKPNVKDVEPNAPGTTASYVQKFEYDNAPGNVKAFMLAVLAPLGYTEADFNAQLLEEAKSEAQPLRGVRVGDKTYRGVNKGKRTPANKGQPLTLHKWSPVEQTPEEIKAARAFLDDRLKGTAPKTETPAPEAKPRTSLLGKLAK